jgi:Domain of unknown function (DUF6484)
MNPNDLPADAAPAAEALERSDASLLSPLLQGDVLPLRGDGVAAAGQGVIIGELLALTDEGVTPLVRYPGHPGSAAVRARSSVDLRGPNIGASVVLMFEQGDPDRPIVIGVLRGQAGWPLGDKPAQVDVDADGQRVIVSAREQLVLRCGKASITLTKAGKVLVEGSYVLSRSTGVNRIKGGSVQLN